MTMAMDADGMADQSGAQRAGGVAPTPLAKALAVQHVCDHRCCVQHLFGNAYRCMSSGQVHVCDCNCGQRVYNDRYSSVCRISRKVFPHTSVEPLPCRKRGCGGDEDAAGADPGATRKRGPGAAVGAGFGGGCGAPSGPADDTMVM